MSDALPHPLQPVFAPASVAVVGASADPTKRGFQILRALLEAGFQGDVHPVNPRGGAILGLPVSPSVAELPVAPDLAVVCTPASTVPEVVAACGERGIRAAVVLAVGFRESGDQGHALEDRVLEAARRHGVRIVGPNTSGLLNLPLGLNLIGARGVRTGALSLLVQSGNMALALMNEATRDSWEGVRVCAGLGNGLDVGFGEALDYLGADPGTRAIVIHAEGIRDARAFLQVAARVTRTTPVVLLKAARSAAGEAAARSHTGSVAGPYQRLRAGLAQAGIVEVTRTDELLPVAATLAWQPPAPAGTGVAVLSDGGGQGTLAVDALSEMNVPLAELGDETRTALRALLGPAAAVSNPVDLAGAADADPEAFARALEILLADPGVGAVLLVGLFGGYGIRFDESLAEGETRAADRMASLARTAGRGLVVHTMYAASRSRPLEVLGQAHIPVVGSLDAACRCAAELWRRGRRLASASWTPEGVPAPGRRHGAVSAALAEGRDLLTEPESRDLLASFGLPFAPAVLAASPEEAVTAAAGWSQGVALKVVSPGIAHKSDAGGVALGLQAPGEVAAAFDALMERAVTFLTARGLPPTVEGILVTPMQPRPLAELLVGACRDPDLGPVLTLGSGGIWVELMEDVATRVLPVTEDDVRTMLRELRVGGVLAGGRGRPPGDLDAVLAAVRAVARCILETPEVSEVEINPLFVYPRGAAPVDARVYVRATPGA